MDNQDKFTKGTLYKIVYSEIEGTFKSPKAFIIGYDINFLYIQFRDGITKAINNKFIISITELTGDEQ